MSNAIYNTIDKYVVSAKCLEPMHVGDSSNGKSEVLIHPVKDVPFIQATSLCGVIRSYCSKIADEKTVKTLFGDTEDTKESKIKITDGQFSSEKDVHIELRPRVKIDPSTGTVSSALLKGEGEVRSGQKFEMQYVAAGAEFSFELYLFGGSENEKNLLLKALSAMNDGEIQIGGQKSNGCGYIGITNVLCGSYDMRNTEDRQKWTVNSGLKEISLPEVQKSDYINAYEIIIKAETESELLVKGIAVNEYGKDAPKAVNIKNAADEYIIPGSSIKGAIRNRMEMIAAYMKLNSLLIDEGFGKASQDNTSGMTGNLKFRDIVVGKETEKNEKKRTRIHIDKFTGGVINRALFSELNVFGDLEIHIQVANHDHPEAVTGLLMLALRDLNSKLYALGGGQNVGKGYINIDDIRIIDRINDVECHLGSGFEILDGEEVLNTCMSKLNDQIVA